MSLSIKDITMEQVRTYNPELYEQIRKSVDPEKEIEKLRNELEISENSNKELSEAVNELKAKMEELTKERDELKAKNDEFEVQEKLNEKREMITKLISEAKAPKELFSEGFQEMLLTKMDSEDEIKAAIEDRVAIFDKNKGKVKDSGEEHIQESTPTGEEATEEEVLEAAIRK